MNQHASVRKALEKPFFEAIGKAAVQLDQKVLAIGGFVRDLILDREVTDIDFVTDGSGIELAELSAQMLGVKTVAVYKRFGTAAFRFDNYDLEFVGARKESYRSESRNPEVERGTLEDDQKRRDFTINAMAISLMPENWGEWIDPFDGMSDLTNGLIKTPLDPDTTYSDDPLRMMRAIRFATQLNFSIDGPSYEAIKRNVERLEIISAERIATELNKIIMAPKPSIGFKLMFNTGLLDRFFPEMVALYGVEWKEGVGHKDNFYHTLQVLDNVAEKSDNLWLRWAAILHDIAKPPTKKFFPDVGWTFYGHEERGARMVPKIFRRLRLPLDHKMRFVKKLVALHLRPIALTKEEISDSAVRRLVFEAGDDIEELMILCRADITSKNEAKVDRYLKNYDRVILKIKEVEEKDRVRNFQPPISGEEIMETFAIGPSYAVGRIKKAIKEAILDGDINNEYEEAQALMIRVAADLGLKPKSESGGNS